MTKAFDRLWKWFGRVPVAADPGDQIAAHLVARSIDVILLGAAVFAVVAGLVQVHYPLLGLVGGAALLVVLRNLLHHGRVRTVAWAFCWIGWLAVSADLSLHGPDTVATGGFVTIVVVGGLTLGARAAGALTLATMALLAPFLLGYVEGQFVTPRGIERLVHYCIQLSLSGVLAGWWALRTRRLLAHLRHSEARRALLLEESPDAIVSCDLNGIITYQNRAAEQLLGYSSAATLGRPWASLAAMQGTDLDALKAGFAGTLSGQSRPPLELMLVHNNGHHVAVETRAVPLRDDGVVVGTLAILRDVSERKKAEQERTSLQNQLVGAQRMEAMGRIAGGVAHDFNNLLTIILGATDGLHADRADPTAIKDIQDSARRGAALTRQLLTFSRSQLGDTRPTNINNAITDVRPMMARLLGDRVVVELELAQPLPAVVLDPGQLDQVLINLAANARDAMPKGGTFRVVTSMRGDNVEIAVSDSGTGMSKETLASAFEPFFTTKGSGGTGLGLSVVHGVVRGAGGTVVVNSELGRGTTFVILLPSTQLVAMPDIAPTVATSGALHRVVVVDDDVMVRRSITRLLSRAGYQVVDLPPPEGMAGVGVIEDSLAGAAALITDVAMPGISGVELALELRRRGNSTPILLVSGHSGDSLRERARGITRSAMLQKPFSAAELRERLERLGQP